MLGLMRRMKNKFIKRKSPIVIEHMEIDFILSGLFDKYNLRILDIGAHHGEICDILERHNDDHRFDMICIEPLLENYLVLNKKAKKYKRINLQLFNIAISDKSGISTFYQGSSSTLFSKTPEWKEIFSNEFSSVKEVNVECYSVKDFIDKYQIDTRNQFDFIKIDTEGHDLHVLKSICDAEIKSYAIMFEIDPRFEETSRGIDVLKTIGFSNFFIFCRTGIPTTYIGEYQGLQQLQDLKEKGKLDAGNVVAFH